MMKLLDYYFIPPELKEIDLKAAMAFFRDTCSAHSREPLICDTPVFILSAGWRSGSTLVQRLICSHKEVLIWGEPFGDRIPVPRMAAMVDGFHRADPHLKYTVNNLFKDPAQTWIANTNPGILPLQQAHQAFFENLFARPCLDSGLTLWGAKFVRLTAAHAHYLKWLYPSAKFIFLTRHPMHSFLSYFGNRWYTIRPRWQVDTMFKFFCHWRFLAASFLDQARSLDAIVVRYEDLIATHTHTVAKLEQFLGYSLDEKVLEKKIGAKPQKDKGRIGFYNFGVCRLLTGSTCRKLGYGFDGIKRKAVVKAWGE